MSDHHLSPWAGRVGAALLLAGALAVLARPAAAQSVHEIVPGGDSVSGALSDAADVDRIPFRSVEGVLLSFTLKAAKGSPLHPRLVVLGPDRREVASATAAMVRSSKGNQVLFKSWPLPATGRYWLEVRSDDGTTGGWTLSTKVKNQKGASASASAAGDGATVAVPFLCPGSSTGTIVVKPAKGSGAAPAFAGLRNPEGGNVLAGTPLVKGTSFTLKSVPLGPGGVYTLLVSSPSGAAGEFTVSAKWKTTKPVRRALAEAQVITDPVVTGVDPETGDPSQVASFTVDVDFAEAGARVVFSKPPSGVTVPGSQVTVGTASATFTLNLQAFQMGVYHVDVVNNDGGTGRLENAFQVFNPTARPLSIDPAFGRDDEVIFGTIQGSYLVGGLAVSLQRGSETIPGTGILGAGSLVTATFDLRGRTVGAWDVVVANPNAAVGTLAGGFDLRNAPPSVVSITPNHDVDGLVATCDLDGTNFDPGATARLERSGQAPIAGTGTIVAPDRVTATFDLTGKALGAWDAVVRNADGQEARLAGGFRAVGAVAAASKAFTLSNDADGPIACCWNASRSEYLLGWIETGSGGTTFDVKLQRLDSSGAVAGSAVSVSAAASSVKKRDVALAWNPVGDEYVVAWSEQKTVTPTPAKGGYHPTSATAIDLYQVYVQRARGSDLVLQGSKTQVTDHQMFQGWYMDEFPNLRTSLAYDAKTKLVTVAWMQEWSTKGLPSGTGTNYSTDDYDVLYRTLDPSNDSLGTFSGIAYGAYHEGDPSAAYDPVNQRVVVAFNGRTGSDTAPLEVYLWAAGGPGTVKVGPSTADNLADPAVAVDSGNGRVLATWTRFPAAGVRSVEAALASASTLAAIGGVVTVASGTTEHHFLARPVYNADERDSIVAWTRLTSGGALSVRQRRVDTSGSSGLALVGSASEMSGQSGDEAAPVGLYAVNPGEFSFLWLKGLSFSTANGYTGSVAGGNYRGKEVWIQRLK